MKPAAIEEILRLRFRANAHVSEVKALSWFTDENTKQVRRDQLIWVFSRRLNGLKQNNSDHSIIAEIESFLGHLEHFTESQTLYHFTASSADFLFSGYLLDDKIVFCIPAQKQ